MSNKTDTLPGTILAFASKEQLEAGSPLSVTALADLFAVSRTPIVSALKQLARDGFAEHRLNRGFFLAVDGREAEQRFAIDRRQAPSDDYIGLTQLVQARGDAGKITAAELVNDLGVTRTRAVSLLDRGMREGWLEKSAGHSWLVRLGITSEADYARLYRFRESIEPTALREPDYAPDKAELDRLREIQQGLANRKIGHLSAVTMFEINRELHETIVAWSGNRFYLDALRQSNDLRRLIEYSKVLETNKIDTFAREHIAILDAIAEGDYVLAESLTRKHLQGARTTKTADQ